MSTKWNRQVREDLEKVSREVFARGPATAVELAGIGDWRSAFGRLYGVLGVVEVDGFEALANFGMEGDQDLSAFCRDLQLINLRDLSDSLRSAWVSIGAPWGLIDQAEVGLRIEQNGLTFEALNNSFWDQVPVIDQKLLQFVQDNREMGSE